MENERELLTAICEAWIRSAAQKGEFDQTCVPVELRQRVFKELNLDNMQLTCLRNCGNNLWLHKETAKVTDLKCYRNKDGKLVIEGQGVCGECGGTMFGSKTAT